MPKKNLELIKILDPCCGSGHMLVYAFQLLYKIYLEFGYPNGKIAEVILNNNLHGLDIDDRAEQLSVLSLLLKAREYDKNIFSKNIKINVYSIKEANYLNREILLEDNNKDIFSYLKNAFLNAKEYGSILKIDYMDYLNETNIIKTTTNSLFKTLLEKEYIPILEQANLLSQKYDIVITNPPYNAKYNNLLKKYIDCFYEISKTDMFSIFMQRGIEFLNENGILSMINQHSWMFLQSFEKLRKLVIDECSIINMIHLGANAFGQGDVGTIVQTTAFTLLKQKMDNNTHFIKLTDYNNSIEKEKYYLMEKQNQINSYYININDFKLLPGNVFAYWLDKKFINLFKKTKISDFSYAKAGIVTGNDEYFLKLWYEIQFKNIKFNEEKFEKSMNKKWVPMNKGGLFRKYYGNTEYIMNLLDLWDDTKTSKSVRRGDVESYFKEGITWSMVSGTNPSYRLSNNKVYGVASPAIYCKDINMSYYCLGFLNTKISKILNEALNPTINVLTGNILSLPIIISETNEKKINDIVKQNVNYCKNDWDSFETSWDFKRHPLIEFINSISSGLSDNYNNEIKIESIKNNYSEIIIREKNKPVNALISSTFDCWTEFCKKRFYQLKQNEEELNRIFIDIYGLQDELTPEVEDKDITIRKADRTREIKSLISYAVGCMFGRYSLDKDGLIYAGGEFDSSKYKTFNADNDNIIPITDEAYFADDIVTRFKQFVEVVYGKETLNENLDYIAETLGKKGTETCEDTIRRFFVNDFYNDHIKTYQKRPIYWLFDSGKKNGFKCLIYMHRYNENTVPKVRLDYLHRIQTTYEKLLTDVNYKLTTELSLSEKKEVQRRQIDLNAKLQEIKEYDEKIAHIANQRICIDLDDGVTVNYSKFNDILAKIK